MIILIKILFFLQISYALARYAKDDSLPKLKWPQKYSLQAKKISLTSGLIEDIKYWRRVNASRVDYNNGADKTIIIHTKKTNSKFLSGVKYEIHPETTEKYENKLFCGQTNGTDEEPIDVDDILPAVRGFKHVGNDTLELGNVEKFEYTDDVTENSQMRYLLWVMLNETSTKPTWIPVKLEELEYVSWLYSLKARTVWEFYNFDINFPSDVFDVTNYNCSIVDDDGNVRPEDKSIDTENVNHAFETFKVKYNKKYEDGDEHALRRNIFHQNLKLIQSHNQKNLSYTLAINKFTDRTPKEKKKMMGLIRKTPEDLGTVPFPYTEADIDDITTMLPNYYDARLLGLVTPVKDQDSCGSCWTFGSTSAVEGALARQNGGRLIRLGNQALVDCAWGYGAGGCNGGSDTIAYHWMMKYGLPTEEEYGPYNNQDGFCRIHNMTTLYPIRGFVDVTPYSEKALKVALINHGPLSVSIHATDDLFAYDSGIYYDFGCDPEILNHEVTLVGYGEKDGEEYWIVKNSWGKGWGIDGYIHFSMRDNNCNVATEPTYVVF